MKLLQVQMSLCLLLRFSKDRLHNLLLDKLILELQFLMSRVMVNQLSLMESQLLQASKVLSLLQQLQIRARSFGSLGLSHSSGKLPRLLQLMFQLILDTNSLVVVSCGSGKNLLSM